jgi:hypothetical protein
MGRFAIDKGNQRLLNLGQFENAHRLGSVDAPRDIIDDRLERDLRHRELDAAGDDSVRKNREMASTWDMDTG